MYLIETSRDLLNVALALGVILLTAFICWFIYYLVMLLKETYKMVREMHERINKVDRLIDSLKEKVEHSASYLFLIGEAVKKLVEVAKEYSGKKKSKKK